MKLVSNHKKFLKNSDHKEALITILTKFLSDSLKLNPESSEGRKNGFSISFVQENLV